MTTGDIILHIFCFADDRMPTLPCHPQAKCYPSELVAIGMVFALKGGSLRAFHRWLKRDDGDWFRKGPLPDRTRLRRLLTVHHERRPSFLAKPTCFTVSDSVLIALIVPMRQDRSVQQRGKQGRDKGRWRVGVTRCWRVNSLGSMAACDWDAMNVDDKRFNRLAQAFIGRTIVLADEGFRDKDGTPENMKIGKRGTWNERMYLETAFSLLSVVCRLKKMFHHLADSIQARRAFIAAMFTVLLGVFHFTPSTRRASSDSHRRVRSLKN